MECCWQDQEDNQIKATEKAMQITTTPLCSPHGIVGDADPGSSLQGS